MKKNRFQFILFLPVCLWFSTRTLAAQDSTVNYKIAVFTPLYLDSAYDDNGDYRYAKDSFPKFINPGLEFYEGIQLALDSLNKEKAPLEVFVYDTRSATETISQQLAGLNDVQLIIAYCGNNEIKTFADAGMKKNIPVINVNLPNDGGVNGNPNYVVLNPTLKTQCEGIYKHIQKYYPLDPIVVFRKKGQNEDRIKSYFDDFSKSTMGVALKFKYVDLPDSFGLNNLRMHLDSVSQTLCIAGSLDENFGKKLVQQLAVLNKFEFVSTVMGMPTWDNISFNKPEFKGIDIIYSSPFYNPKIDKVSQGINSYFNKVMYARASDMVYRGYEVAMRFGRLLLQYGNDLGSNITNRQTRVFTDFDIQPVISKPSMTLDYFENKKLYFLKWGDGVLKGVY